MIFTWQKDVNGNYYRKYITLAELLQRVRKLATSPEFEVKKITNVSDVRCEILSDRQ